MKTINKGSGCFITQGILEDVNISFLHSSDTYSGTFISSPKRVASMEETFIENAIDKFKKLCYVETPYQIFKSYQENYPEVLNTRLCMTQLHDKKSMEIGVIWFDNGIKDVRESLLDILSKIDWSIAIEIDW